MREMADDKMPPTTTPVFQNSACDIATYFTMEMNSTDARMGVERMLESWDSVTNATWHW